MRTIGEIPSEADARRFSDFLLVQGIPNQIESGNNGHWDVWVHSDDDLTRAREWLGAFLTNPSSPQFSATDEAARLRAAEEKENQAFQNRMRTRSHLFRRFVPFRVGPLTAVLICICIGVYLWSELGTNLWKIRGLFFSIMSEPALGARLLASPEIRAGEVWRLITPMFIHFTMFVFGLPIPIHLIFNMLWLRDLGGMIETIEGYWRLLVLVVVSAAISNWAQYVIDGPRFGGMSGVVYGLLGYVWMKGKFQPWLGLYLHKETVVMMMMWLVACFVIFPNVVANWAHLGGLVVGVVWGFLSARRAF